MRITSPAATSLLSSVVVETTKLYGAFSSSWRASASVRPTTIAARPAGRGPTDTTMLIVVACSTCSPAGGSVRITAFSAIVVALLGRDLADLEPGRAEDPLGLVERLALDVGDLLQLLAAG